MLLVIPIDSEFKKTTSANNGWLDIVNFFPGGISGLASLALLWRDDRESFMADSLEMFMDAQDALSDNDLDSYNKQQLELVVGSDTFTLFLDLFFDIQTNIYAGVFGQSKLVDFDQIKCRNSNLCVKVRDYEKQR